MEQGTVTGTKPKHPRENAAASVCSLAGGEHENSLDRTHGWRPILCRIQERGQGATPLKKKLASTSGNSCHAQKFENAKKLDSLKDPM